MVFNKTKLNDAYVLDVEKREDTRGYFARVWCQKELEAHGLNSALAQANISFNKKKGTVRGMHYQLPPHREVKLVRCVRGKIYDVIIDLRTESSTYKKTFGIELSPKNGKMLYVPEGFAHGYQTLEDNSEVLYWVSQFYAPGSEGGVRWNDPVFQINWPVNQNVIISEKDGSWPNFED